jgi:Flp pilus assembly protein TadG
MRNLSARGLRQAVTRLIDDRHGIVAAITAMLVVPLVLAIGLAIDASRMFLVRAKLSQAVDAAALAAGQALDVAAVTADARRIFAINYPEAYLGAGVDLPEVNYDADTGQVEIIARTSMPTMFMQLAHVETLDVEARALVVREQRGMELALVLDVSGSMCKPSSAPCTNPTGSRIADLKLAAKDLIDIVYGPNDTAEDLYVAIVPFNSRVKIGTSRTAWLTGPAPSGWKGCVEQRAGSLAYNDVPPSGGLWAATPTSVPVGSSTYTIPCNSEVSTLQASKSSVKLAIDALRADGGTRIDTAAGWGWRILSERWQGLWGTVGLPLNDDDDPAKAVVIMSDGTNEPYAPIDGSTTVAQADSSLSSTCQAMRDAGYVVFTVAFQAPASGQTVLSNCAGSSVNFFNSPTSADLRRAFRQIGGRLSALRLAE